MKCSKLKKVEGRFELEHMRRKPKHLGNRKLHHLTEITTNREQTPSLHAHAGRTNTKSKQVQKKQIPTRNQRHCMHSPLDLYWACQPGRRCHRGVQHLTMTQPAMLHWIAPT